MLRSLILIALIGSTSLAQAFFCLPFEKNSANQTRSYRHTRAAPSAIFFRLPPARFPIHEQPINVDNDLPSIIPAKASPEIIQGYRFRPTRVQAVKNSSWPTDNR